MELSVTEISLQMTGRFINCENQFGSEDPLLFNLNVMKNNIQ